ncbi:MAG: hypothetical protein LH702_18670 [Phormidesmis sp. CAN_BIN44]|nr:hypothetical protein [Phormidesmis sp. CAN_BIN44]
MGKRSKRQQAKGSSEPRFREIDPRRVQELRYQIEIDLCNAVTQGYLSGKGVFLAYRREHMPELPEAAKLYQQENPDDSVQYLGLDPDDGKYTIQIAPSLKWLFSIRSMLPNFTFERIEAAPDPICD